MKQVSEMIKSSLIYHTNTVIYKRTRDVYLQVRGVKDLVLARIMNVRVILRRRFGEGFWVE